MWTRKWLCICFRHVKQKVFVIVLVPQSTFYQCQEKKPLNYWSSLKWLISNEVFSTEVLYTARGSSIYRRVVNMLDINLTLLLLRSEKLNFSRTTFCFRSLNLKSSSFLHDISLRTSSIIQARERKFNHVARQHFFHHTSSTNRSKSHIDYLMS